MSRAIESLPSPLLSHVMSSGRPRSRNNRSLNSSAQNDAGRSLLHGGVEAMPVDGDAVLGRLVVGWREGRDVIGPRMHPAIPPQAPLDAAARAEIVTVLQRLGAA
jgi:hypothetical protein